MKPDAVTRLRAHIATLPVRPAPSLDRLLKPRRPRGNPWLVPVAAALTVVAILVGVLVRPGSSIVAQGDRRPSLPDRMARYSYLTTKASDHPPGRAIALYQHGFGFEQRDDPQLLVLGADGDVYRRVDLAEARGTFATIGDRGLPPAMVLSPDGTRVAIGGPGDVAVLDLSTGRAATWPAPGAATPLAWSPDGNTLAVALGHTQLALYDMRAPGPPNVIYTGSVEMAAFSPDGQKIAVQDGAALVLLDRTGKVLASLPTGGANLATSTAWSPDGRWLALRSRQLIPERGAYLEQISVVFIDPSGNNATAPAALATSAEFAGAWTGPDRFLVKQGEDFVEVDLKTGRTRVLTTFTSAPFDNYMMASMQFASGLLLDVSTRSAGSPERGPWPAWLRISVTSGLILAGLVTALAVWLIRRRLRQPR